jgi:murein DD-endopeptidase MepM/ murein hydrolase activator NlpD
MSGFDVSRADSRRSRAVVALASFSMSALLLIGLTTTRSAPTEAATPDIADISSVTVAEALPVENNVSTPSIVPYALAETAVGTVFDIDTAALEHAAFTGCLDCPALTQIEREVPRGGTLAGLLDDAGVDRVEAARAIASMQGVYDLRYLRAGQDINLYLEIMPSTESSDTSSGAAGLRLAGLSFRPDVERAITVARTWDDDFRARETIAEFDAEMVRATGTITTSLYVDALQAGATDRVVVELAGVLAYAIDFQRSIRAGDEFDILFERFVDEEGDVARTGDILYASYDGRGEPKEFYRYETPDGIVGYYSPDGASAQRLLMLTPINGARLSSHFGRRRHPILGYTRAHNGTDFAAPLGTPILAAGNGVVERANRYGSFGNYLRIRHANGFQTAYAHLNGFARGVRAGTRVTQGQVVAYVGTTGRSTGPHLHYEVHQNGRPVNPMTLDLPTGRQLADDEIALFEAERDRIIAIRDSAVSARADVPVVADASNGAQ